jgi:hypothetical protein
MMTPQKHPKLVVVTQFPWGLGHRFYSHLRPDPAVISLPCELMIGRAGQWYWPNLDALPRHPSIGDADRAFDHLQEAQLLATRPADAIDFFLDPQLGLAGAGARSFLPVSPSQRKHYDAFLQGIGKDVLTNGSYVMAYLSSLATSWELIARNSQPTLLLVYLPHLLLHPKSVRRLTADVADATLLIAASPPETSFHQLAAHSCDGSSVVTHGAELMANWEKALLHCQALMAGSDLRVALWASQPPEACDSPMAGLALSRGTAHHPEVLDGLAKVLPTAQTVVAPAGRIDPPAELMPALARCGNAYSQLLHATS